MAYLNKHFLLITISAQTDYVNIHNEDMYEGLGGVE